MVFLDGQAKGRARQIPPQTDPFGRFAPEYVVLFLHLSNFGIRNTTRLLLIVTRSGLFLVMLCSPWGAFISR